MQQTREITTIMRRSRLLSFYQNKVLQPLVYLMASMHVKRLVQLLIISQLAGAMISCVSQPKNVDVPMPTNEPVVELPTEIAEEIPEVITIETIVPEVVETATPSVDQLATEGEIDLESLSPAAQANYAEFYRRLFVVQRGNNGDGNIDGALLADIDAYEVLLVGDSPYAFGPDIDMVYGGGTQTVLVMGEGLDEVLVMHVVGANNALMKAGSPRDAVSIDHVRRVALDADGNIVAVVVGNVVNDGLSIVEWVPEELNNLDPSIRSAGLNEETGRYEVWTGESVGKGELRYWFDRDAGQWVNSMVETELSYGERSMSFMFTAEEGVFERTQGYGDYSVFGFELNPENPNAAQQLEDVIIESLRQAYLEQNPGANVSADDLMNDPSTSIDIFTHNSWETGVLEEVKLAKIKAIRYNLTTDSAKIYSTSLGGSRVGFEWSEEDGVLTIHSEIVYLGIGVIVEYYQDGISGDNGYRREFDPKTYPYYISADQLFDITSNFAFIGASPHLWGDGYSEAHARSTYFQAVESIRSISGMYLDFTDETIVDSGGNDLGGPYMRDHGIFKALTLID